MNAARPGPTTAERLMDATLESIHRHGYGRTTVTTVTEIAGLSRGMVRHEFGAKQPMVVASLTWLCERWLHETEPDPSLPGDGQVRAVVHAMFDDSAFNAVNVDAWVTLSVEARSDPDLREVYDLTQRRWVEQLTTAFVAADVADPPGAALAVLATADGLWLQQRAGGQSLDGERAAATVLMVAEALLAAS